MAFFTINPKPVQPREVVRRLGDLKPFDRFIMDGKEWMKLHDGIKRTTGRTPKQRYQVDPSTEVLVP